VWCFEIRKTGSTRKSLTPGGLLMKAAGARGSVATDTPVRCNGGLASTVDFSEHAVNELLFRTRWSSMSYAELVLESEVGAEFPSE